MDKKKIIVVGLVVVGVLLGAFLLMKFFFSKGVPSLPGGKVKLVYWGLWEPANVMAPLIEEFEKKNKGVEVEYIKQSPIEYRERLVNAIAQGRGPDIFRFHNTWTMMLKDDLSGVPDSVFNKSEFEKTFYPIVVKSVRMGNSFYGVPLGIDTLALFYNEDLFLAGGVTVPSTWAELREAASKLTVRDGYGRIQTAGAAIGTTGNVDFWSDILGLMMLQDGVDFSKIDNSISSDGRNLAEEVLNYFTQYVRVDRVWDETMPSSIAAFADGKVAMIFGPSWVAHEIRNKNPNFSFKVVVIPQLSETEVNWATFWVEGVSAKSKHQKEAWEFVKFLSSKETMRKFYSEAVKSGRLFGEPYSRMDMKTDLAGDSFVSVFLNQAENAESWYLADKTHDNGINDKIIKYFEDAVNSINSGEDSLSALKTASLGVGQVLSVYGLQ